MYVRIALLAGFSIAAMAQSGLPKPERIGNLSIDRNFATWTSPELLVRDLRSDDEATRAKAQRLFGIGLQEEFFPEAREIELRYDDPKQVIVLASGGQYAYAAIAVPTSNGWKRLVSFACFCQYGGQELDHFFHRELVEHERAQHRVDLSSPPVEEIVLRSVGGGSGLYEETEDRFELQNESVRHVLSFVSRRDAFVAGSGGMTLHERRWFRNNQLVEGIQSVSSEVQATWDLKEPTQFRTVSCTPYKFDDANFRYVPSGPAKPCAAKTP